MSKAEIVFDAITGVREELVEQALDHRFRRRIPWGRYAALAACLALLLGIGRFLPFFLGGVGGSNNSALTSDSAAPENAAPGSNTSQTTGSAGSASSGAEDGAGGDSAHTEEAVFTATVLETHDGWLLVEPVRGLNSYDRVQVSTQDLADLPEIKEGDLVEVVFDGLVMASEPAQVAAVRITVQP